MYRKIFQGLQKCGNPHCTNYVKEGSWKLRNEKAYCSFTCIHLAQISEILEVKEHSHADLMEEIRKHFEAYCSDLGCPPERVPIPEKEEKKEIVLEKGDVPKPPSKMMEYLVLLELSFREKHEGEIREAVEFAACIFDLKEKKEKFTFQRFVKPEGLALRTEELKSCNVTLENISSGNVLKEVLLQFDNFLKEHSIFDKIFSLVFVHQAPREHLLDEMKSKKLEIPPYFTSYISLKNVMINLYRTKKGMFNTQSIETRLKHAPIEKCIRHCKEMCNLLNLKNLPRNTSNLDLIHNLSRIIVKLLEKSVNFTDEFQMN